MRAETLIIHKMAYFYQKQTRCYRERNNKIRFKTKQIAVMALITQIQLFNNIIMKGHLLIAIFSLISLTNSIQSNKSLSLSQFNCQLFYQQSNNGALTFNHCQSLTYETNNFSFSAWKQCVGICCGIGQAFNPYFNQKSLAQCFQSNESCLKTKNVINIIILVASIISGLAFTVFIVYKIVYKCKNNKIVQKGQINPDETIDINVPIWLQQNQQVNQATLSNINKEELNECPICLQENTNLLTGCFHRFHIHCLLTWFTKNKNCPLCKRTKITYLKLKCKNCQNKYLLLSATTALKNIKKLVEFQNVCGKCSFSPIIRVRSSTRDESFAKFNHLQVFGEPGITQT